jgi:hypothetical protein
MPPNYNYNTPPPPNNVRTSRAAPQQQQFAPQQQQFAPQQQQFAPQQQQFAPQQQQFAPQKQQEDYVAQQNPINKIRVSDAVFLMTLRLGRVEQWIIQTENENSEKLDSLKSLSRLSENSQMIDASVVNSIIERIDSLENKESVTLNADQISALSGDVSKLTEQLSRIGDETTKHNLLIAKHTEQLFKFERDLVENKDILKTFMMKFDMFVKDTIDRFGDFEFAITEIEKDLHPPSISDIVSSDLANEVSNGVNLEQSVLTTDDVTNSVVEQDTNVDFQTETNALILSDELKNSINEELTAST